MSTLYADAAASLTSFLTQRVSLKSLLLSPSSASTPLPPSHAKRFALITETLRYKPLLDRVIDSCRLSHLHPSLTRPLLLVLLYDLLFGPHKAIEGGGHLKRLLLTQRHPIHSALARLYIAHGASTPLGLLPPALRPRPPPPPLRPHQRPPHLPCSGHLCTAGAGIHTRNPSPAPLPPVVLPRPGRPLPPRLPPLHLLPLQPPLHLQPPHPAGQGLHPPPLCLNPSPADVVVDACAAPGNKTSQLMAMMRKKGGAEGGGGGGVEAFEVDFKRFGLLVEMMEKKGCEVRVECREGCHSEVEQGKGKRLRRGGAAAAAVTVHHASFLSLDGSQGLGARVTSLLLDPTCSGSGMMHTIDAYYRQRNREEEKEQLAAQRQQRKKLTRQGRRTAHPHPQPHPHRKRPRGEEDEVDGAEELEEEQMEGDEEEERQAALENQPTLQPELASLADFQVSLLLHAFTLPSLTHLVYSTCSVHVQENEAVIARALAERGRALGWTVEGGLLPSWPRRGLPTPPLTVDECTRMIRCDPDEDLMNGFFVCGLRKGGGERAVESEGDCAARGLGEAEEAKVEVAAAPKEGGQSKKNRRKKKKKRKRKSTDASAVVEAGPLS